MARTSPKGSHGDANQRAYTRSSEPYDGYKNISLDLISDLRGHPEEFESETGTFGDVKIEGVTRQFFVFPTSRGSPEKRKDIVYKLISFIYKLENGNSDTQIEGVILRSLAAKDKGEEQHWGENLGRSVDNVPLHSGDPGHQKLIALAEKQPGPRVPQLPSVLHCHIPEDTLRLLRYYGLSDEKARHLRGCAVIGLATEYSVKKLERDLDGCEAPKGYVETESITFTK